ncbi:uncharacterized protein L969DRAFT_84731 [Mixia osmundae IAM 14324]|uniref:diphosphoinositol-polyphosphate diphosphatase n=1 Tax=Mixia osmundae (strain CBS 9802 / IAM 14324 / JCM 22182 / KY 12970) TaxID=764103 RepID=G7DTH5_MIXOS|nr:uncharacterized protein L969DRAFT_84731 [Mixia osmundae IAM 14324]KEI42840.1 hypothetical protein L969DRAFT_84731 [Mixia osmundae IAM 14324]GAA93822.1 hypothetical protein E5Q_00468 [Mixia osmundae IAM 14324]
MAAAGLGAHPPRVPAFLQSIIQDRASQQRFYGHTASSSAVLTPVNGAVSRDESEPSKLSDGHDASEGANRLLASLRAAALAVQDDTQEDLVPPENYAMIAPCIYRSSFPKKKNFPFLKSLGLKSVLTLILEEYPEQNLKFLQDENIKFLQFGIPGNKEPFVQIPDEMIKEALVAIFDTRNHPMLIHCNKGKHRTGCLVGCIRKMQQWSHTSIFEEYRRFSEPKARSMDQQFIELFDIRDVWMEIDERFVPAWLI